MKGRFETGRGGEAEMMIVQASLNNQDNDTTSEVGKYRVLHLLSE